MSSPLEVRAERAWFRYPDGREAVIDVEFRIEAGAAAAIIGPNGGGKTTLLGLLAGVHRPTTGATLLGDTPAHLARPGLAGLVFQEPDDQLFMPSVREDVEFGPRNLGLTESEAAQRTDGALGAVGLDAYGSRHPHHLSGGEKRLAAIAAVLAMHPGALLLDEPTADLDHRARRRLIDLLSRRSETRIIATHDLEMALEICPRCIIMEQGRIVADGATARMLQDAVLMQRHGLETPWSLRAEHRHSVMPEDPHHAEHHRLGLPHVHGRGA